MIESGLWMEVSDTQESGHVFNSTCWNCGGTGHCAEKFPSKNAPGLNPNKFRGRWFAPRDGKPDMKIIVILLSIGIKNWKILSYQAQHFLTAVAKVAF